MSLERVLEEARRELLAVPSVVAVSYRDGVIVVYVEDESISRLSSPGCSEVATTIAPRGSSC